MIKSDYQSIKQLAATWETHKVDVNHVCPKCEEVASTMLHQSRSAVSKLFRRKLYRLRQQNLDKQKTRKLLTSLMTMGVSTRKKKKIQ